MAGSPGGSTSPYQASIRERSMGDSRELGLHSWHSFGQGTRFCRITNSVFEGKVTEAAPAEKQRNGQPCATHLQTLHQSQADAQKQDRRPSIWFDQEDARRP